MIRSLLICALLCSMAGASFAQQSQPGAQGAAAEPAADEFLALNFYVQQGDQPAIAAELRRLQLKYPGWRPPADLTRLSVTEPSSEIDEVYRLIAAGRHEEARKAIAAAKVSYPTWQPPAAMLALLETSEGQARLDAAMASGNLQRMLGIVGEVPGLLRCDRINNAWRIAEAQAGAGRKADALGTYRAVASACVDPAELVATLEKADSVADEAEILALIAAVEARLPAMQPELERLRKQLLAGRGKIDIPAAAVKPDARAAATAAPKEKAAEPKAAAAPAAVAAGGSGAAVSSSSVQAAFAAGDWARCLALSSGSRQTGVLYQRGWCAYNSDQPMEAVNAFRAALGGRLSGDQRRDAAYGIALAYLKMGMSEEASRLAVSTDFTRKQRIDIERQILDQRGVNAYKRRDYRAAISYFNALEELTGGIRRDLALLRAYAYLNGGNRDEARRQFQKLNRELSTSETRRGLQATSGG
ncbi:tetratricopeptide repeat protein [Pseudogemmobacter faecipullorum]|uniref:Tetratricopeptide repeat protein n=1 Tax=Pseudogemmobacter faecipullorum TaxID=2755041 RepID=A0ABS8CNZ9_9RHOB|nr:tetratricopeptide repeat protein [Pseudogemmobacter faecipullorum]MCB5411104.1 hypothetical protein [Pseudogemmobacter faecipullorum]